jgi:hypothetical protein
MALASAIITSSRYDLRDTGSTEYTNAELLDYLNRGQVQLYSVLQSLHSDWVHASDTSVTLLEDGNSVSVPSDFASVRTIWIDDDMLTKKDVDYIYYKRKHITGTAQPVFFATEAQTFIFEYAADQDYDLTIYYNKDSTDLELTDSTPFNGKFDQPLRQMVVLQAKSRNEYDLMGDAAIYDFMMDAALGKVVSRNRQPKGYRLNF